MRTISENSVTNLFTMENQPKTLLEKTTAILNTLPSEVSNEMGVLVSLVKLLIEEVNNSELSSLKSLIQVQKTVTDGLVEENRRLRDENKMLHERLNDLEEDVDSIDQHGRNVNLVLKGIPEEKLKPPQREKTTQKFVDALNKHYDNDNKLVMADITRSHRLGKYRRNATKPRPIIARFALETKKMDTFRAKRKLKGKGISLAENLTNFRNNLHKTACDLSDYKDVWTWEGRVYALINGEKTNIRCLNDIPGYADRDLTM